MKLNKKGKKMRIKYGINVDALRINAQEAYENTLEGIATKDERDIQKLLENPRKYYKKGR